MRTRLLVILLTLALASGNAPLPARDAPEDLTAGIALLKEGDFEGAVVKLDAAVRGLEDGGSATQLAQAYLFLGVAYLELDQEALARGKFAQALARQPQMRLDPSEFSAQVIRIFETTRQEALPAAANEGGPGSVPPSDAATPSPGAVAEEGRRKRSVVPFVIVGGALAAGGVALASSGGNPTPPASPSPSPSASPTPSPSPSASPTPRPTPPPACTFSASPASQPPFDKDGGTGVCRIDASRSDCAWNAVSTRSWIVITRGTPGRGDGTVGFTVLQNQADASRVAEIHLQEDPNARCQIRQEEGFAPGVVLTWTSTLQAPAASGKLLLDGGFAALQGPGASSGTQMLPPGVHRFEAVLTAAAGRPGVWRFRFAGAFRPGSLRVHAGEAVGVSPAGVVFRLRGAPGERVVFELAVAR